MTPISPPFLRLPLERLLLAILLSPAILQADEAERRAHLQWMQESLPEVVEWNAWQEATRELPPDFDNLSRSEFLPDPLQFLNGRRVTTVADWQARRTEILAQHQHSLWGQFPPKPDLQRIAAGAVIEGDGFTTRSVRLEFGPGKGASVRVEVSLPEGPGPFPAVITPSLGGWIEHLIPRGYAAVGFAGNDFMDDTAVLADLYADFDFAALPRRAWVVSMLLDYLETLPRIDQERIAIYGYSRDGKMATIAAALDERLAALIAGSTGVGGVLPWRLAGEAGMGEGVESTTRMFPAWFHPRLRFFSGHEDRLPVDANLLLATIAPRACLIQYALNDEVSNAWALERSHDSALKVYELFGKPERLGLLREPGFHGSIDPQRCLDWLDIQFGRTTKQTWQHERLFAWDFEDWRARHAAGFDLNSYPVIDPTQPLLVDAGSSETAIRSWENQVAGIRQSVMELLGQPPPQPPAPPSPFRRTGPLPGPTNGQGSGPGQSRPDVPAWVIDRGIAEFGWLNEDTATVDSVRLRFGRGLHGDLYLPRDRPPAETLPTVIWLHGYSYPLGYMWVYRQDPHPILALTQAGYAVFAFDQTGFGYRQEEAAHFYDRHPHWSRLGKMVTDVSAAIDVLQEQKTVDAERIYALGYTLGGTVSLHAAAMDERVRGVVSIAGFTPMRSDVADSGSSGIARFSHQRNLIPRLGLFIGEEPRIPYDYDELIAAIAPRPVLVLQPAKGRGASLSDVQATLSRAREVYTLYGAASALSFTQPDDYTRLTAETQDQVIRWMKTHFP